MAVASQSPAGTVRFGEFELDLVRTELRKASAVVNLAPQPLRVLALLVSNAGELVPRETIRLKLWGEDVSVDFEHGLNTCIRQIRVALGDEARSWRFIETVPRRGYRFHIPGPPGNMPSFHHWKLAAGLAVATGVLGIAGYRMVYTTHSARVAQAHDLVVQGRLLSSRITADAQRNAISVFERALILDPKNAAAHAGIALAYLDMAFDLAGAKNTRLRIQHEVQTALALDAGTADSHLAAAELKDRFGHDSLGAEQDFRGALRVDPNSMDGHGRLGEFLLRHGRFSESEAEIRKALALDPQSVRDNYRLACVKYYGRDYDAAIAQLRTTLQLDPRYAWAHHVLGLTLLGKRQYEEAIQELEKSQRGPNGNLGNAYAMSGRRDAALKVLDELKLRYEKGGGASEFARVYIGLGEYDTALEWLDTAVAKGSRMVMERIAPTFDPLRNDPRFLELLRKADLNQ